MTSATRSSRRKMLLLHWHLVDRFHQNSVLSPRTAIQRTSTGPWLPITPRPLYPLHPALPRPRLSPARGRHRRHPCRTTNLKFKCAHEPFVATAWVWA
ncbi:hypothetical protein L596_013190 [Steinernema carpocapsae]|uniref:Uncharacterized protein n=1 Tax=Steinernema carpocapsae TaxID=34508 RepID=A0A4U5NZE3_STECR|nr:hypothetical protein L596_013190 [Steinernema carpocapsae]